jgi:hypothetical protein
VRRASLLLVLLLAGCASAGEHGTTKSAKLHPHDARAGGAAADQSLPQQLGLPFRPALRITVDRDGYEAGRVEFTANKAFELATAEFAREARAIRVKVDGIPGAVGFRIDHPRAEKSIERWNRKYLKQGAYVFRYENTEGYNGGRDGVILLPTRDKWSVIRAAAVNGANYDLLTPSVVKWLQRLDARHPFTVYGAGIDFVEGRFATRPHGQEAVVLAKSMYHFDPDIVDQGVGSVNALARELEANGTLYLWWD